MMAWSDITWVALSFVQAFGSYIPDDGAFSVVSAWVVRMLFMTVTFSSLSDGVMKGKGLILSMLSFKVHLLPLPQGVCSLGV
jgi:hypothetical protein